MSAAEEVDDQKLLAKWRWLGRIMLDQAELPARSVDVAFWLIEHADKNDRAWPSRQTMATLLGCSERTVDSALAGLRKRGWITPIGARPARGFTRQWALNREHAQNFARASGLNPAGQRMVSRITGKPALGSAETLERAQRFAQTRAESCDERAQEVADYPSHTSLPSIPPTTEPPSAAPPAQRRQGWEKSKRGDATKGRGIQGVGSVLVDVAKGAGVDLRDRRPEFDRLRIQKLARQNAHQRLSAALAPALLLALLEHPESGEIERRAIESEIREHGSGVLVIAHSLGQSLTEAA